MFVKNGRRIKVNKEEVALHTEPPATKNKGAPKWAFRKVEDHFFDIP